MSRFDERAKDWDKKQTTLDKSDACINHLKEKIDFSNIKNILDYGCGTGLIAFNLVEENNAQIARWSYKTVKISSENVVIGEIPRICRNNIYHNREEIFRDYENVHEVLSCDWTGLYDRKFLNRHNIKFNEK